MPEDEVIKELKNKLELHLIEEHGLYHTGRATYQEVLDVHYQEHHPDESSECCLAAG